ncbi:MAG TPA: alpha/beta hydrolase [Amycolatopsis sp.]|uniref:alpha/beta fold hydrolase n=1 Tax=Amycolatopsis sp. TaxID=37632 RepID=UPI002B4688B2|nr:alpha/beta hydrolase [Amycolatopsis sp.]HKS47201.1 alpha/beta hydrolase [Amycolatopsis sp.]
MSYLRINGTDLYYEDEGAGRPILFLHGWGTSGRVWHAQLPEFVRDHRQVVLDWRGCGRSGRPVAGNDIDGAVADLVGVLDRLDLDQPVVAGSSIGAVFAIELALRHPERVGHVVAVDGPGYWPSTGMTGKLAELREALVGDRARTLAQWVPNWYAPGTSPALADWTVRQILDSGVHIDQHFTELTTYDPRPALPSLRVPVTYIHGELDPQIPVEVAETCAELTPDAKLVVIEGSGHMPHQEKVPQFNAALRAVL